MDFIKKLVDQLPNILHATTSPTDTPYLKAHKLNKDKLLEVDILDILKRFFQSAGNLQNLE